MMAAVMAPAARPGQGFVLVAGSAALVLLVFLKPATALAEGDLALRATLDEVRARHDVPALWGGRFHADGRRVFAVSGVRKHGEVDPARLDDLVHIGSCTKAMTAVMVARRCSRETLTFDTTLAELFPSVGTGDGGTLAASAWGEVTVDELLRHTSGAPANPDWWALHRAHPGDPVAARRALLEWLLSQERPAEPGFLYSNVGYALLGHIVESIEGKPWETLVSDEVFQPLGLTTAALGPAGRVHLTIADWSRFVLAFTADGDNTDRARLGVSPRDWARLLEPRDGGNYAGGWVLHDRAWGGGRVLSHSGSNTTWYCVAWVAPGRDFCLLGATNTGAPEAGKACDEAVSACLDPRLLPFDDAAERR